MAVKYIGQRSRHPIFKHLKEKQKSHNNKGWLRKAEAAASGRPIKKQLREDEKQLVFKLWLSINKIEDTAGSLLAFAWGVHPDTVRKGIVGKLLNSVDMTIERKTRSDAGNCIFTSEKKRKEVFTARCCFVQKRRKTMHSQGEQLTPQELEELWKNASPEEKQFTLTHPAK